MDFVVGSGYTSAIGIFYISIFLQMVQKENEAQ